MLRVLRIDVVTLQRIEQSLVQSTSGIILPTRTHSTKTTSGATGTRKEVPPILSSLSDHRKPRIELRPGPIKPQPSVRPSLELESLPLPVQSDAGREQIQIQAQCKSEDISYKQDEQLGVKQMVEKDIQHAESLGILQPTPVGAPPWKRVFHKTKELAKFYFRGAKTIYVRQQEIFAIQRRIKNGGLPLQRLEYRMMKVQVQDISKVIPFIIIALLLEEVIPIIAIYAPAMLPSTWILPGQRLRIEQKKSKRAAEAAKMFPSLLERFRQVEAGTGLLPLSTVHENNGGVLFCRLLRLPTFGFESWRILRLRHHLNFIIRDDTYFSVDDSSLKLSEADLDEALRERGCDPSEMTVDTKRHYLDWWLRSIKETSEADGLSRRLALIMNQQSPKH